MVTIKDSAGNPVPNALFQLSRDYSTNRAGVNQGASASAADDVAVTEFLPVNPQFPESAFTLNAPYAGSASSTRYERVGADGKATFTLNQDKGTGLKTVFTASLTNDASKKPSCP